MSGQQEEAADSIARAERLVGVDTGPLPDGFSSAEASLATLQGVFPWGNVRQAHAHALRALELEGPGSPWHALACWAVAMAHLARGELAEADELFTEAIATSRGHWLMACAALAYRSLIAGQTGRLEEQLHLAEDSGALAREHGLQDHTAGPSMALGMSLIARGRPAEAVPVLERGVTLARFQGQPLVLLRTLRYLAEALTRLGRHDHAAAVAAEARSVLAACVDPAMLGDSSTSSARQARERGTSLTGRLTHRELTVLTLLAGGRSEADIGRELFVSHSTVHSHAKSIYRKLDVSSRAAALERARAAGFL
jgi:LuxR family maltose regulon positive regulatory protein